MKRMGQKRCLGGIIFLAIFAGAAAVVMLLWNWLIPGVIGWASLTYLQAAGLLLLCKLLFGGFGGRGWHKPHAHMHPYMMKPEDRMRMREQVRGMSVDQRREYIRKHMFGEGGCRPREATDGKTDGGE